MNTSRFDRIARVFAERRVARRQAPPVDAATPPASPLPEFPAQDKIPYLFVQSFQGGSLTANPDADTHTLTLEHGLGQTVYFSDRPGRDVGISPTPQFLEALGFSAENPPNAALVVDVGGGETDIAVVELFDPSYDEATHTATYQVRALAAWEDNPEQGFHQAPADLTGMTPSFGTAHLLIDDCPDGEVRCTNNNNKGTSFWGGNPFCYNYGQCMPCYPYGHSQPDSCATLHEWTNLCTQLDPDLCSAENGGCTAFWPLAEWLMC